MRMLLMRFLYFFLILCIGCAKPELVNHPEPELVSHPEKFWNGHQHDYCKITVERIQAMGLSLPKTTAHDVTIQSAQAMHAKGLISEAIWELEESSLRGAAALAASYKMELRTLLESDHFYEDTTRNLGGISDKMVLQFDQGSSAVFKYTNGAPYLFNTSFPMEWAAYAFDQLLRTSLVPMTILRQVKGHTGSLQHFVTGLHRSDASVVQSKNFPVLRVFDFMIGNTDRKMDNLLWSPTLERVVAIDHGMTFQAEALDHNPDHSCGTAMEAAQFVKQVPQLKSRIIRLTQDELSQSLSQHLSQETIALTWARIAALQKILE